MAAEWDEVLMDLYSVLRVDRATSIAAVQQTFNQKHWHRSNDQGRATSLDRQAISEVMSNLRRARDVLTLLLSDLNNPTKITRFTYDERCRASLMSSTLQFCQ